MKLTPRLQTIAEKVHKGNIVADIGTDHGYIPIYLIENNYSPKVIAADINVGPLENARRQILSYGYVDRIETRLGNGLDILKPGEVSTIIVAGMGGLLIRDILLANPCVTQNVKQLILQPMVAQSDLRQWLIHNGFKIVDEQLAKEGHKYYEIIVAARGNQIIHDDVYFDIGPKLIENKDPLLIEYIRKQIHIQKIIINELEGQDSIHAKDKYSECKNKILKLEEVLKCLLDAKQS